MPIRTQISQAPPTDFEPLRTVVRAPVILPADPDYDTARAIWNGAIDRLASSVARESPMSSPRLASPAS